MQSLKVFGQKLKLISLKLYKKILLISGVTLMVGLTSLWLIGKQISFNRDFAKVLYDRYGNIIQASVSKDEQWRMHCDQAMPAHLKKAILLFEDEYFYKHPGVNPLSILKAMKANFKAKKVVRGGSTITMQLARISQGNKARSYVQKTKEIVLSFALELLYTKEEILNLYGQYAPFGGNVVGYCAASWKYFEKPASQLSWAEVASLAVLPNAPAKIFPGQDQSSFLRKRNFLLHKLEAKDHFDKLSLKLALKEDLPNRIYHFEARAPHLHQYLKSAKASNILSTVDGNLQAKAIETLDHYGRTYSSSGINNLSAIILDNHSGEVLSYVGNRDHSANQTNRDVDINQAERSPGSTLKPLLYGLAFDDGIISPGSLMEDVPIFLNGFSPQNYDRTFSGLIKSSDALTQSLNIPAVNLLQEYGVQLFIDQLVSMGFENTDKDDDHYGLSLILGSNEVSLMELARAYMNLARTVSKKAALEPSFQLNNRHQRDHKFPISSVSARQILEILTEVKRPRQRDGWEHFNSKQKLAWKTGTSFGNRDAWAVGVLPSYTIVVWVGNASGEGRKGLTGLSKAGPILFSLVDLLPREDWFGPILHDYKTTEVCLHSAFKLGPHCSAGKIVQVAKDAGQLKTCQYHAHFVLDSTRNYQISSRCYDVAKGIDTNMFVLKPRINHYLKLAKGQDFSAPKMHPDCVNNSHQLAIIYPPSESRVLLPREINNEHQGLISKAATANSQDTLFWFVDNDFIQYTVNDHSLLIHNLEIGKHAIAVSSISGAQTTTVFEVIDE